MTYLRPHRLVPQSTIGIVSPSSWLPQDGLRSAQTYLEAQGYQVQLAPHVYDQERYLAGTDGDRAADIMAMVHDPNVAAIMVARGGYGAMRLLDKLDYDAIAQARKPLVGFSDTTALQLALLAKANLGSVSGVTLYADLKRGALDETIEDHLWRALRHYPIELPNLKSHSPSASSVIRGSLVGGCLALFTHLLGTPYFPDLTHAILVLEDVHEEPYKLDRMLTQLRLAGVFNQVAAVVLGDFYECVAKDPSDGPVEAVLADVIRHSSAPVFTNLNYGHGPSRCVLPLGAQAELNSASGTLIIN